MSACVKDCLRSGTGRLEAAGIAAPSLEASVLLAHALGQTRTWLFAWPEAAVANEARSAYEALISRRSNGEPVAHLVGEREFWSLRLRVSPHTLIPRPATELLVERALALLPADADSLVADLGTGSGAIAAAIAGERPRWRIVAVDSSTEALEVAAGNFVRLGLTRVQPVLGDWLAPLRHHHFDLLVSNPPYVPDQDPHLHRGDVRFEPTQALAAGPDGLRDLRTLIQDAPACLVPGGWLLLEHGWDQGEKVRRLLHAAGFTQVASHSDLAGHERVSEGRYALLPATSDG